LQAILVPIPGPLIFGRKCQENSVFSFAFGVRNRSSDVRISAAPDLERHAVSVGTFRNQAGSVPYETQSRKRWRKICSFPAECIND
jgi:hypothetical protein